VRGLTSQKKKKKKRRRRIGRNVGTRWRLKEKYMKKKEALVHEIKEEESQRKG
jgi:hypothetical protein